MRRLEKKLRNITSLKRRLGKEIGCVDSFKEKTMKGIELCRYLQREDQERK